MTSASTEYGQKELKLKWLFCQQEWWEMDGVDKEKKWTLMDVNGLKWTGRGEVDGVDGGKEWTGCKMGNVFFLLKKNVIAFYSGSW